MSRSVLADAPFVQTTLTFTTEGGWGTDENGNPVPIPGDPIKLLALLAPDGEKQLRMTPGADAKLIPMKGELVEPLAFPDGVGLGTELTLSWDGSPYTLKLTSLTPNDLIGVDFGTAFAGEATPDV